MIYLMQRYCDFSLFLMVTIVSFVITSIRTILFYVAAKRSIFTHIRIKLGFLEEEAEVSTLCEHSTKDCLKCLIGQYLSLGNHQQRLRDFLVLIFFFFDPPLHCSQHCPAVPNLSSLEHLRNELIHILERRQSRQRAAEVARLYEHGVFRTLMLNFARFNQKLNSNSSTSSESSNGLASSSSPRPASAEGSEWGEETKSRIDDFAWSLLGLLSEQSDSFEFMKGKRRLACTDRTKPLLLRSAYPQITRGQSESRDESAYANDVTLSRPMIEEIFDESDGETNSLTDNKRIQVVVAGQVVEFTEVEEGESSEDESGKRVGAKVCEEFDKTETRDDSAEDSPENKERALVVRKQETRILPYYGGVIQQCWNRYLSTTTEIAEFLLDRRFSASLASSSSGLVQSLGSSLQRQWFAIMKRKFNVRGMMNAFNQEIANLIAKRPLPRLILPENIRAAYYNMGLKEALFSDVMPIFVVKQRDFDFSSFVNPLVVKRTDTIMPQEKQREGIFCWGKISLKGKRDKMEDEFVIDKSYHRRQPRKLRRYTTFFGIYDGHGGRAAANFAKKYLHKNTAFCVTKSNIEENMRIGFERTENMFSMGARISGDCSGTTAITVALDPADHSCVISSLGDCRAIICRGGRISELTHDHTPADPLEREQAVRLGGFIAGGRVNGSISVTRSLGDLNADGAKTAGLSAKPDVVSVPLGSDFEFLMIACDGCWELGSSELLGREMRRQLRVSNSPQRAVELFADYLLSRHASDNITVIVIAEERKDESGNLYFISPPRRRISKQYSLPSISLGDRLGKKKKCASFASMRMLMEQ